jgi:hypothetical protein
MPDLIPGLVTDRRRVAARRVRWVVVVAGAVAVGAVLAAVIVVGGVLAAFALAGLL